MRGWRLAAACIGAPLEWFFQAEGVGNKHDWSKAQELCNRCPVAEQCLDYALTNEGGVAYTGRSGMYGGKTPMQRDALWRETHELPTLLHVDDNARLEMHQRGLTVEEIAAVVGIRVDSMQEWFKRRNLTPNTKDVTL